MRWSLNAGIAVLPVAAALSFAVPFATAPAQSPRVSADGFAICALTNSGGKLMQDKIGPCEPLTEQAMNGFGLSADQIGIVAALQNLGATDGFDPPPRLIRSSLEQVREFAAVGAFSDYWFPDVADPANVSLGVHLRYRVDDTRPRLFQMTYGVDGSNGHFTVIWNRGMVSPRR